MSLISIIGTPLYQWETGRKLKIIPLRGMRVDSVHISNYGDKTALVVKPREENGAYIADIPNILLQDDRSIAVYSVNVSKDKTETLRECVFSIQKRAKPSDYIYTETEVFTYKALEERLKKLEENGIGEDQVADAVKDYLEQNPIEEADPSVPEWAKQPEKPEYSADEVGALSKDALQDGVNLALQQAKESGVFDGKDGNDYILTESDKKEIADMIPAPEMPGGTLAVSVEDFGAIGDGIADDTASIQTALDACHASGGGTVIIPNGIYILSNAVKFYSNQRIIGEPGAVLLQRDGNTGGSWGNLMRNYYNGSGGYDATENVIIEGLTFDGGTQEEAPSTLLAFCHAKNITVRGCTFRSGFSGGDVGNGHDIEVNSSKDVKISHCDFVSNRRKGLQSELVQIDSAGGSSNYPWDADAGSRIDDKTVSASVTVANCYFKGILHEDVYSRNVCVGSHCGDTCENIIITGCTMEDVAYGVLFGYGRNIFVHGNYILNSTVGFYTNVADENLRFIGNILENCGNAYRTSRISGHGNMLNGVHFEEHDVSGGGSVDLTGYAKEEFVTEAIADALRDFEPPTGGANNQFRLIRDITIPEDITTDISGVNYIYGDEAETGVLFGFDTDANGNPFELTELVVITTNAGSIATTTTPAAKVNFTSAIPSAIGGNGVEISGVTINGGKGHGISHIIILDNNLCFAYQTTFGGSTRNAVQSTSKPIDIQTDKICKISTRFQNGNYLGFTVGSQFRFYGR